MRYRKLGTTDIEVSVVAMGCWAIVGDFTWGPQDEADSIATIHAALDSGITLLDTAESYGDGYSEVLLGKALAGRRQEAVIASKVSGNRHDLQGIRQACDESLGRLKTDYIDLYQLHWPNWDIPFAETMGALAKLKEEGKVRAVGVCNFGPRDLTDVLATGHVETNQLSYSLLWRAIEWEIQPLCVQNGVGILTYSPLLQGLLTGKFATAADVPDSRARTRHFSSARPHGRHGEPGQEAATFAALDRIRGVCERLGLPMAEVALAWLLAQPGVTSVLAGARHPGQIAENVKAADLELPAEALAALSTATEPLKVALGTNPDMWQTKEKSRIR